MSNIKFKTSVLIDWDFKKNDVLEFLSSLGVLLDFLEWFKEDFQLGVFETLSGLNIKLAKEYNKNKEKAQKTFEEMITYESNKPYLELNVFDGCLEIPKSLNLLENGTLDSNSIEVVRQVIKAKEAWVTDCLSNTGFPVVFIQSFVGEVENGN